MDLYKDLPFRLPIKAAFNGSSERRNSWGWSCHNTGDYSTWSIMYRVIENNIGKSFDMAFHYYCKLVPVYCQKDFLELFIQKEKYYRRYNKVYVDEQGLIQRFEPENKYKGPYKVYSDDYKVYYIRKKKKYDRYWTVGKSYIKKDRLDYWDDPDDFKKLYHGTIWEFESKKNPVYVKYKREQFKKAKKRDKDLKKERKLRSEEIFNKGIWVEKERLIKQKELDLLKRNQAGFDENSFIGDAYHGRKNKKK